MGRRTGLLAGSIAVALAVAGCGGGSPSAAPTSNGDVLRVIQAAASSTAQQKSMQVSGTMSMDLGANGTVSGTLAGVLQNKPLLGRLTMSGFSFAGRSFGNITVLMTPQAIFMNMPVLTQATGKPWGELKFSEMKSQSGVSLSQLMSQAQQMQPAQYIAQLTASGDVHVVGNETVNGVQTTHYAGTVSLADALSHYNAATRAQMQPLLEQSGFTGSALDVWLDGKGLVRRMHMAMQGGKGSFTFGMDVLAYGVPVNVTPPPASQVADLAQLTTGGSIG